MCEEMCRYFFYSVRKSPISGRFLLNLWVMTTCDRRLLRSLIIWKLKTPQQTQLDSISIEMSSTEITPDDADKLAHVSSSEDSNCNSITFAVLNTRKQLEIQFLVIVLDFFVRSSLLSVQRVGIAHNRKWKILILWYYAMRTTSRIFNESGGVALLHCRWLMPSLSSHFLHGLRNIFKSPSVTNYSVRSCGLPMEKNSLLITQSSVGWDDVNIWLDFSSCVPREIFFGILNFQFPSIFLLFKLMRFRTAVLLKYAWMDERLKWVKRE